MLRPFQSAILRAAILPAFAALLLPSAAFAGKHKPAVPAPPPVKATQPPACTIPVAQLGFAAPGEYYLGARYAMVSLDFLDENRLLFTFRVPGLFHREPNGDAAETERRIRAYVLHIPDGTVQAEALWTLHDRQRYVLPLDSGQFLLRDRDYLSVGDSSLQVVPWMHFPGPLVWVETDPERVLIAADTRERAKAQSGSTDAAADDASQAARAPVTDTVLRVLRGSPDPEHEAKLSVDRPPGPSSNPVSNPSSNPDSNQTVGQVLLMAQVHSPVHLPLNQKGYLEPLRSLGIQWVVNMDYFGGGSARVGAVDSTCVPSLDFVSATEYLASVCNRLGNHGIVALSMDGRRLWATTTSDTDIWPVLAPSRNGMRLARETLQTSHLVNATMPLSPSDITGQEVVVLDAATGRVALRAQASPIFDAGGNFALSPSGRRAAVLMDGGIQVFELPEAPPMPAAPLDPVTSHE